MRFSIRVVFAVFLLLAGCGGGSSDTSESYDPQPPSLPPADPPPADPPPADPPPADPPPLTAPLRVSASDAAYADAVHLNWSPVTGAVGYEVHVRPEQGADYVLLGQTQQTSFADVQAPLQRARQYAVKAIGQGGDSGPLSDFDSGHLSQSAQCAATPYEGDDVQLFSQLKHGFHTPRALAFDAGGFLYVGSAGSSVYKLNQTRHVVAKWEGLGDIKAMANGIDGVVVLNGGQLLRLQEDCTQTVVVDGLSTDTTDLAVDSKGNYYISEHSFTEDRSRVLGFAPDGSETGRWLLPDAGGRARALDAIAIDPQDDDRLYGADGWNFEILELSANGDEMDVVDTRKFPVVAAVADLIVDSDQLFLTTRSGKGDTQLTYFHSGLQGGALIHDVSAGYKNQITQIDIDRSSGHIYMADPRMGLFYACEAPLYFCSYDLRGGTPAKMVQDAMGNVYVAYAKPAYIAKLNSNGGHLANWYPPEDLGRVLDMEIKEDLLYLSAIDHADEKSLLLEVDTDFTQWSTREIVPTWFAGSAYLAVGGEHIFFGDLDIDGDGFLVAVVNGIRSMDDEIDLQLSLDEPQYILSLDAVEISADRTIYCLLTTVSPAGVDQTVLAKYDLLTDQWLPADIYDGFNRISGLQADNGDHLFYLISDTATGSRKLVRSNPASGDITEMDFPYPFSAGAMMPANDGASAYFYRSRDHSLYKVQLPEH